MSQPGVARVVAVVDNVQDVQYPLDYSFKAINRFQDALRERPRARGAHGALVLEDELAADDSTDTVDLQVTASRSTAFRLNNNLLTSWDGFLDTVSRLYADHTARLQWLDLAFNDLKTIDDCILDLPSLMMLYLHGNNIGRIASINKLSSLVKLKSLTLHGNPIETNPGYRQYVITHLPQLHTVDFSAVTKSDQAKAESWRTMLAPTCTPKRKGKQNADE